MSIEFLDCNVRLGRTNNPLDSKIHTSAQIREHMKHCGIKGALVFHNEALTDWRGGNRLLADEIAGHPELYGCAVVVPACTGEYNADEYFSELDTLGFRAVRLFPKLNNFIMKPWSMEETLKGALKHKFPVLIDYIDYSDPMLPYSTWDFSPDYEEIYEIAHAYPENNFIVVIPGMQSQRKQYAILAKTENVYLECSSFGYSSIEHICSNFGCRRLIFGSYMPVLEPGAFMTYIMYADISVEEKAAIAGGNLRKLMGGRDE